MMLRFTRTMEDAIEARPHLPTVKKPQIQWICGFFTVGEIEMQENFV